MTKGPDVNDTLRDKGRDAVRARSDNAKTYRGNSKQKPEEQLPPSSWYGEAPVRPPPALIKGLLPQTGVAIIGGQSGAGKTFQAIYLAGCVIPELGQKFYIDKYPIKRQGGVFYLVLEGRPAFPIRVETAFNQLRPPDLLAPRRLPFASNSYRPYLYEKGPDSLIRLVEREALKMRKDFSVDLVTVFIDTMGLAACYENEDKSAQIQRVVTGLDKLSDATGALVIGVDHYGKAQEAGLRGASAKRDCVETVLALLVDRNADGTASNHRMVLAKVRDGEEGRVIPYRLGSVELGKDEDGDPVSTCCVVWEPERKAVTPGKAGRPRAKPDEFIDALTTAIAKSGQVIQANGSGAVRAVERDTVRFAFKSLVPGSAEAVRAKWKRALRAAIDMRVVVEGTIDGRVYLWPYPTPF
jgi:hypothetical protein